MLASDLRVLGRGIVRGWRDHQGLLIVTWIVTLAACGFAASVGGLYYFLDFREPGLGRWSGVFTVLSAMCLACAGFAVLIVARRRFLRSGLDAATVAWTVAGVGGIYLGLDELVQLHEAFARKVERWGAPRPFGFGDHDFYVFAGYAIVAFFVARLTWSDLVRWNQAALPGVLAVLCFIVSFLIDMPEWDFLSREQQRLWGPIEEIVKTVGSVHLALFGLFLDEASARDVAGAEDGPATRRPPTRSPS